MPGPAFDDAVRGTVRTCYSAGMDLTTLHDRALQSLDRVVPFDASFMATADPDTLLFTRAFADEPLAGAASRFLDNEFGADVDVNRFVDLARRADPVASLDGATAGHRAQSGRWQEIMRPMGLGDELRVALRVDGTVWGYLCLHRAGASGFHRHELEVLRTVAPHLGAAIRRVTSVSAGVGPVGTTKPLETVILAANEVVLAVAGDDVDIDGEPLVIGGRLPVPLDAVVHRLESIERGTTDTTPSPAASIRMNLGNGVIVSVHAARLRDASGRGPVVLTLGPATPSERSSLLLAAHGLTPAQCRVATLVVQGRTTGEIVLALSISAHTVQDHLKAVFDKIGVRSRRELVSSMMRPVRH